MNSEAGKSIFGIKREDISNIVRVNYILLIVEGLFGFVVVYYIFHVITLALLSAIVACALFPNLLLSLLLKINARQFFLDLGMIIITIFLALSLTAVVNFFPDARPSFLLIYVPGIIFSCSQSLSLGIIDLAAILIAFGSMTYLELSGHKLFAVDLINYSNMTAGWKIGVAFTFLILMIISAMTLYFSSILRKRALQISQLAEMNKKLYQRSKATSDEIVSNMKEALVVVDDNFIIIQNNKAFQTLIGQNISLTNMSLNSLNIRMLKTLNNYLFELQTAKTKDLQLTINDKYFHKYDINISPIELQDKKIGYIVLIIESSVPWGSVFNTSNGLPVELAVIRLMRAEDKKIVETRVTDRDGRFSFTVRPGSYYLTVLADRFQFPSKRIKEGYHGEKFDITSESEGLVKLNIPIDSTAPKPAVGDSETANLAVPNPAPAQPAPTSSVPINPLPANPTK